MNCPSVSCPILCRSVRCISAIGTVTMLLNCEASPLPSSAKLDTSSSRAHNTSPCAKDPVSNKTSELSVEYSRELTVDDLLLVLQGLAAYHSASSRTRSSEPAISAQVGYLGSESSPTGR